MGRHRLLGTAAVALALAAPPVASAAPTDYAKGKRLLVTLF